ncbi:type II secretion system F family protein [Adlercreutzia sp. R21]|uniref:type II secretion system F family protein n=1 Tax=Adlercreutzia wanghongyangiae TaxID=3111451 RepID=UPI002DBB2BE9|nr:type II secretion system F family protein [Adlercreutzia sp. R21]MEC4184670.1 type II secretion system F family protein [Adlercreutzia sp. R21]
MEPIVQPLLFGGALLGAAGIGWAAARWWQGLRQRARYRDVLRSSDADAAWLLSHRLSMRDDSSLDGRIIAYALLVDQRATSSRFRFLAPRSLRHVLPEDRIARAGLDGQLGAAGWGEARVRLTFAVALAGGAVGLIASPELGLCLGILGTVAGWRALPWAVGRRCRRRAEAMERDLSELLDVVALGMRSGLSFDRSLHLYTEHFQTLLASSFRAAHRQWSCGLASRDQALRQVATSYDSPLLARVVENVVRSLRFGSTLADNLEDAAREARSAYRARKQEQVAKAPVKMMVPTGVLILPAMLILVLGPVLLELAGGF